MAGYAKQRSNWQDFPVTSTPITAANLNGLETAIYDLKYLTYNVKDYGATGDGSTDDTAAIQAAITAGLAVQGTVLFPPPSVAYKVTSTINIVPSSGSQAYVNLIGAPMNESHKVIDWAGGNSTSVFSTKGWRLSSVQNLGVRIPNTSSSVTVWNIDTDAVAVSSTGLDFRNSSVLVSTGGAGTGCIGWRMGASGLTNDISCISWYDCQVSAGDATKNHIGWSFEQTNAVGFSWYGGIGYYLNPMIQVVSGEGFATHGLHGSHNATDFLLSTNAITPLTVVGGRFELGDKFLNVAHNTNQPQNINIVGTKIYNYTPTGGIMFRCLGVPNLLLDNVMIVNRGGADYTSSMIWHYCDGAGTGRTRIKGGVIQAPYPFHTINSGSTATYNIRAEGVQRVTNAGVYSAMLGADQANALTYGTTVATDANLSDYFTLAVTNGTAFTILDPTNLFSGRTLTYDIKNSSGGAMGVVTWGSSTTATGVNALNSATVNVGSTTAFAAAGSFRMGGVETAYTGKTGTSFTGCGNHAATTGGEVISTTLFKLDATGFVNPANTKRKMMTVKCDGTNLIQIGPTSADI